MNSNNTTKVACTICHQYCHEELVAAVAAAVAAAGGWPEKIKKAESLLLNPNLLSARHPDQAVTTHPDLIRAVICELRKLGIKRIVLGDSPAGSYSWSKLWDTTGMSELAAAENIELLPFEKVRRVECRNGITVPLLYELEEFDAVISLPKLKTHILTKVTAAVKNTYGLIPGSAKSMFHGSYQSPLSMGEFIADFYGLVKPDFIIMDAVICMEGEGPANGSPYPLGLVFAGEDAAAIDSCACEAFNYTAGDIPLLRKVEANGFGIVDSNSIERVGNGWEILRTSQPKRSHSDFLHRIPQRLFHVLTLFLSFRPHIDQKSCVRCGICAKVCSQNAIIKNKRNGQYQVQSSKCILCMCCMESCAEHAITLKPFWRRWRIPFSKFTWIAIVSLLILPLLLMCGSRLFLKYSLQQKINDLNAAGMPTDFQQLQIWYENGGSFPAKGEKITKIPADKNGAVAFAKVAKLFVEKVPNPDYRETPEDKNKSDYEQWFNSEQSSDAEGRYLNNKQIIVIGTSDFMSNNYLTEKLPAKVKQASGLHLQANLPALEQVRKAIAKPHFIRYNIYNGPNSFPALSTYRQAARRLSMQTHLAIDDDNSQLALQSIIENIQLSQIQKNEPFLISYLVRIACLGIVLSDIEMLLNKIQLTEKQLAVLDNKLQNVDIHDMHNVLVTERAYTLGYPGWDKHIADKIIYSNDFLRYYHKYLQGVFAWFIRLSGLVEQQKILLLNSAGRFIDLAGKSDYYQIKDCSRNLEKQFRGQLLVQMATYDRLFISRSRIEADIRLCRTAVAIERYRLKYGKLPEKLPDLVPEFLAAVPLDPFDGRNLRYRKGAISKRLLCRMTEAELAAETEKKQQTQKNKDGFGFGDIFGNKNVKKKPYRRFNYPIAGWKEADVKKNGCIIYSIGENSKDDGGTPDKRIGRDSDQTFTIIHSSVL